MYLLINGDKPTSGHLDYSTSDRGTFQYFQAHPGLKTTVHVYLLFGETTSVFVRPVAVSEWGYIYNSIPAYECENT